jgi:hypothetical protein
MKPRGMRWPDTGKVLHGTLGLRAPQGIGRHLQLAHAVVFDSETLACSFAHCINSALLQLGKGKRRLAGCRFPGWRLRQRYSLARSVG